MPKVPSRLDKDPIFEATFEFRFQGKVAAVADVLHGAIYPKLKDRFPRIQRNPLSAFGTELIDDPNFRYQSRLILTGDKLMVHIGDRAIAVTSIRPYIGWKRLLPLILETIELLMQTDVVKEPERISLRYTNLLEAPSPAEQFSFVHYQASLGRGPYKLNNLLTHTRTEIEKEGVTTIVELGANTVVQTANGTFKGLGLAVDSIYNTPPHFLQDPAPHIEKVHSVEKSIFFDLLTDQAIESMGPEWE